ncbi:hematopoietic prostaglandin D synthase-like [Gigantopelta aegis]|uniref:hematopoietic prostaglandin D synthase-like n=1 Tax=Gigantopelta aegis TaxID=1735272 RepID=UPI001B88A2B9|nr:hematopoietic prostaglandin D synthase-like [Gigantopelta aegis]
MPTYKLTYFDFHGRGELARLIFAIAGVPYEDERIKQEQWPELKSKMPNGQMPVLEVDGKMYSQSLAIARYLANEFNLMGNTNLENLRIDEVCGTIQDLIGCYVKCVIRNKEKDETLFAEFREKDIPQYLKIFESFLNENENGVFVGNKVRSLCIYTLVCYSCTVLNSINLIRIQFSFYYPRP